MSRTVVYKRGRPPVIANGDTVDLTSWPLRSKPDGRPIELCPKCGRKGECSRYRDGSVSYTHSKRLESIFWMVKDSCHLKAGELETP